MDPVLLEKFIKAVKKYNMIVEGDRLLVGFSGGPDSVFLVEILRAVESYFGITFSCLHINHMLRGEESYRDEVFCKRFCEERKIELFVERVDVRSLKREEESIEEVARRVRYEKYEDYLQRYGFNKVVLAHTASDSVETFLINLLRGTGIMGLKGIPPVRGKIIRPLIYITRKEIENYLGSKGVSYVIDSSNLDTKFLRNRIRLELLPYLEEIRPGAFDKIRETSEIMVDFAGFLETELERMEKEVLKNAFSWAILIDCSKFRNYHYLLQKLLIQRRLNLTYKDVESIENLIVTKKSGKVKGFQVFSSKEEVFIAPENKTFSEVQVSLENLPLTVEELNLMVKPSEKFSENLFVMGFTEDDFPVKLRTWRPGDIYMGKKLSDLFGSRRINVWKRRYYPVFESKGQIVWVPGFRMDKVRGEIFLEVRKIDEGKYWIFDN
ncbi:MAG: tRNA lysidine(34) synthetase TilS [bacterium]|nr:tRNA lysidine(34) synthetase TilS [bacterium]